ncbi:MAG TPA: non-homologous end-joining DNA ligase [Capillimicrobium sp.]|nr:non-homologous end-joining DNA ligase [Capillimicrobium sp.]
MSSEPLEVGGRELRIANLGRVLYPQTQTTKAELLDYYVRVAPAMLPHLRDRLLHLHRYPEGVTGPRFWQKGCPDFRPEWMPTAPVWSRDKGEHIEYCVINEVAALLWAVNIGSLELHTSLHRRDALERPTVIAFDLDPGEGAGLVECCEVALWVRDVLEGVDLRAWPKTSGGKGLQLYVPLNDDDVTYAVTKPLSHRVAELLEAREPDRVVSRMARALRRGKVLIDWSQNTTHKSMVCAYSARAKERPTVSTPVTWAEVEAVVDAGDPSALVFELADVLARVEEHGDLFAGVLTERQPLP